MHISASILTLALGLLGAVRADYDDYSLGRRSANADDLDLYDDIFVRDVEEDDLDFNHIYIRNLENSYRGLMRRQAIELNALKRRASSRSSSSSRGSTPPVETQGGVTYVNMGGSTSVQAGTKVTIGGLNSCVGLIAVGSSGAYAAHITPGRESSGASSAKAKLASLGSRPTVHIKVPDNMPSDHVRVFNEAFSGHASVHMTKYKVASGGTGSEMKLRWSGSTPSVS